MQVFFEYEVTAESINECQFYNELRTYCKEVLIEDVYGPIMQNADRLMCDKCFVALLHKWYLRSNELSNLIDVKQAQGFTPDELEELLNKSVLQREYDQLSWLLGDLL